MELQEPAPPPMRPAHASQVLRRWEVSIDDLTLVESLREAGRLGELDDAALSDIADLVTAEPGPARRLDLLQHYYAADGQVDASERRVLADRFFLHQAEEPITAHALVGKLSALAPEVGPVSLERIGSHDGPLVLRAGDHFSAVVDDTEELDTGEIDLSEIENGSPTITVRGLVRALNVLLDCNDVRERLIELRSDGEREAYIGVPVGRAVALCDGGLLEDEDPEDLMEFAGW